MATPARSNGNAATRRQANDDPTQPLLGQARGTRAAAGASSLSSSVGSRRPPPVQRIIVTPAASPSASNRQLITDILKLSGPISCTTVVEFLPQILIAAMVGHADPLTAMPAGKGDTEGAVLTAYGLANLVYSTAAFSLVYGFICGLDSVAASSYGMTLRDCATGQATPVPPGTSEYTVAPTPGGHGTNLASRKIAWQSPALRGLYITPTRRRCRSAHCMEVQPIGGTPGRYPAPSSIPATVLRRSPSVPLDLSLARQTSVNSLASLEERSHYGAWKRRPDEGIDAGPDTPEDHDHGEEISAAFAQHLNQIVVPIAHTHPHAHNHFLDELSVPSPSHRQYQSSSSSASSLGLHHGFQPIHPTLDGDSPGDMAPLDLGPLSPRMPDVSWDVSASAAAQNEGLPSASKSVTPPGELPSSLIGVWIKRCLMLEMIVVVALIVLLYFGCAPFLRAMGEPEDAIDVASEYVIAASLGLPFVAVYHSCNKGLQSSGIVFPVLCISFAAKLFSCVAVWVGLYHLAMNLVGIAWILAGSIAAQAIAVYAYMQHAGIVDQWWGSPSSARQANRPANELATAASSSSGASCGGGGVVDQKLLLLSVNRVDGSEREPGSAAADDEVDQEIMEERANGCCTEYWTGLWEYSVLAFPACAAICLEFWLFDILGALAGLLPNPSVELSVHYLLFTATLASYMIFSGLSVSVSVLVGQKLGLPGQSHNAKQSAIVGTVACLCVSGALILFLLFFHDTVGRCLTSQPKLLARFTECVPVLIAYQAVDGLNTCSTQLLRTLGVQKYGVLLHFTTYYVVGMTSGYLLAFPLGYGVKGLWIGLCVGVGLNACFATFWLWFRADWEEQSNAAIDRTVSMCDAATQQAQHPRTSPTYLSNGERSHRKAAHDEHHGV